MKGAFEIFRRDLKNIFKNYGAIIVVIALCILPSFRGAFHQYKDLFSLKICYLLDIDHLV